MGGRGIPANHAEEPSQPGARWRAAGHSAPTMRGWKPGPRDSLSSAAWDRSFVGGVPSGRPVRLSSMFRGKILGRVVDFGRGDALLPSRLPPPGTGSEVWRRACLAKPGRELPKAQPMASWRGRHPSDPSTMPGRRAALNCGGLPHLASDRPAWPGASINRPPSPPSAGLGRPLSHRENSLRAVAGAQAADSGVRRGCGSWPFRRAASGPGAVDTLSRGRNRVREEGADIPPQGSSCSETGKVSSEGKAGS